LDRLLVPAEFLPSEKLAFLSAVKEEHLKGFVENLLEEKPESLLFGNISPSLAAPLARTLEGKFASRASPQLCTRPGDFTHIFPSANNNNAILRRYEVGAFSIHAYAVLSVLQCLLNDSMFNELRTKQHLGYVVQAVLDARFRHLGLVLVIQSASFSPEILQERLLLFLDEYQQTLSRLSAVDLEALLDSVAGKMENAEIGFEERREAVWRHILQKDYAFEEKLQVSTQIRKLALEDVMIMLKDLRERPSTLSVQASEEGQTGGVSLDYFLGSSNT
jgi:insulysin